MPTIVLSSGRSVAHIPDDVTLDSEIRKLTSISKNAIIVNFNSARMCAHIRPSATPCGTLDKLNYSHERIFVLESEDEVKEVGAYINKGNPHKITEITYCGTCARGKGKITIP